MEQSLIPNVNRRLVWNSSGFFPHAYVLLQNAWKTLRVVWVVGFFLISVVFWASPLTMTLKNIFWPDDIFLSCSLWTETNTPSLFSSLLLTSIFFFQEFQEIFRTLQRKCAQKSSLLKKGPYNRGWNHRLDFCKCFHGFHCLDCSQNCNEK